MFCCVLQDDKSTLFLIAGYGRYNCPYVWVRSNHERLVKLTGESREKDCPLKLKSTLKWKDNGMHFSCVLVCLNFQSETFSFEHYWFSFAGSF